MKKYINTEELRNVQLDILKHVDNFCKENDIKYFLCGGSMIGAVRHHGFIPWDDDIDIMLLREDYEKFISIYSEKDKSEYKLHSLLTDKKYSSTYVKIDNSRTVLKEYVEEPTAEIGINIDVFPVDDLPNNKEAQKKIYKRYGYYRALIDLKNVRFSKERVWYKNLVLLISHLLLKPVSMRKLADLIENNAVKYKGKTSDYCGIVVWGYGLREINYRKNWDDCILVDFEDMKAPIPVGYDNYLTCVYGDYMKLPPEEKRISHHAFEAYWKE